jgi:5'-nucleotidase (lipoprotein e(P4) family)
MLRSRIFPMPAKFLVTIVLCLAGAFSFLSTGQAQTPPSSMAKQTGADNEYQTGGILWTQSSAEYRALAYQAFALARLRLDADLRSHSRAVQRRPRQTRHSSLPPAVVVDIDETILDNSRFQAELVLRGLTYTPESWTAWCERAEAGAVPGAVDFLNYAMTCGVRVFYITNRRLPEKPGTIKNLQTLGFPTVNEETVMVREEGSTPSKESRRKSVRDRYRIVLLIGDNLNDFNDDFAGKSTAERAAQVNRERVEFGSRYIVVPNPMYGDWENALYDNKSRLTEAEKRAYRRAALKGF